jgi:acylphosphatase
MKSYTCIVEGKVTGGKFQSWVLDTAQRLGLKGWVRNIDDGKAEILVQGESDDVFAILQERLRTEAPVPDLKSVSCTAIEYDKVHEKFEARG